ncbi:unnamed protein product [Spirodela intermedia]|uniref:Uncharacterized protein n=2 Tax=Spirodela intermedia TaxID=51605 RepID=A0A7I8ISG5_SPIIN|nr:unnamed protein product [Spirodela intermedia]CAA6659903.1 unnamed protein product [Spirodela intermedia]CAA7396226.1 unnamed protein product [Spirodela intermedia]
MKPRRRWWCPWWLA